MAVAEHPIRIQERSAERAARRALHAQIAKLEREASEALIAAFPNGRGPAPRTVQGARLLGLGELEQVRDRLVARLAERRAAAALLSEAQALAREQLERMLLDPARHRHVRIPNAALGAGGCGVWRVRPRLGLVGMLAGWWEVKLSSGCPLPDGPPITSPH
jgi:hypothetical protein